jgi:hypothetical protein
METANARGYLGRHDLFVVFRLVGINLPVDAGFIAGSTWDAYGGLREPPEA